MFLFRFFMFYFMYKCQVWGLTWFQCHSRILKWWVQALCHLFFAFFNFFLMFLFRFFMFYFMFKCESPPNSVAYDWWRRQSYATLLDWTMGSGGLFRCVPLGIWGLAYVPLCAATGIWNSTHCVPLLASGCLGSGGCSAVCRYWHLELNPLCAATGIGLFGIWGLAYVPLCAAIGIRGWNFGIWGLFFYFVPLLALPCAAVGLAKSR